MPISIPRSAIRFMMKASLAAQEALSFSYQKPISAQEHRPTPSHPMKRPAKLSLMTSTIIEKTKAESHAKKRLKDRS